MGKRRLQQTRGLQASLYHSSSSSAAAGYTTFKVFFMLHNYWSLNRLQGRPTLLRPFGIYSNTTLQTKFRFLTNVLPTNVYNP